MLIETLHATRDIGRVHEIAVILIRYGFGDMVRRLGFSNIIDQAGKVLHWAEAEELAHQEPPARVRKALEEMGPTFVKLGQILATRPDIFAPNWIEEFKKLQDHVQPVPFAEIEPQIREDLEENLDDIFTNFNTEAIAAASISQVYKAKLKDGSDVIVKVRRPGIRPKVEADLRFLKILAEIAEKESKEFKRYHPLAIVHQFTLSMRRELDLAGECRNAERIAANFKNKPDLVIPNVYWQWTSERMNVQEYIDGIPASNLKNIEELGLNNQDLARRGANIVLKMVLEDGFFHADPHPGNLFFLPENKIAFIDFGMVGRLSESRRTQVVNLLQSVVHRHSDGVVKILLRWSEDQAVDIDTLTMDVETFIHMYHGVPLKEIDIADLFSDLTTLLRDHELSLPPDLALLIKALITLEGMGRELDPDFNLVEVATPFLQNAIFKRYSPEAIVKLGFNNFINIIDMLTGLPEDMHRLLEAARRGAIGVKMDISKPDWLEKELDRAVNRLSVSLVTAALIVGSSIVTTVEGGSSSFFGLIGFTGAALGGIWLLISIWRSG